jgi:aryl-alcohol dehydrogenase-like predicted oxidoreductase
MCRTLGVATVVYNPLAGGLLTGKHRAAAPLPGTRFDLMKSYVDRYWHDANFTAMQELTAIAVQSNRSLVSLALNWVLHHSAADCLIVGASKLEHLKDYLSALEEGALPATAVTACDRVWDRLRGPSPKYNR